MRPFILLTFLTSLTTLTKAQKVDSIYFHPYTDSLKKGTYNYINVDGKLSNGRWLPLTAKEIDFTSSAGVFSGNSLFIDSTFKGQKITIKAVLKENPAISKEIIIYIKTTIPNERLKTTDELLEEWKQKGKDKKKKKGTVDG
ncbi:MAG TPA: hypothetical protein VEV87_09445 [Chitinophagaceae bacterium]|nr:hypothetical protein [Chitinophagaceae bacterium]